LTVLFGLFVSEANYPCSASEQRIGYDARVTTGANYDY
jgi:hypothetical protein